MGEIKKDGLVAYGIKEVKHAAGMGAVSSLAVTDSLILTTREKNTFKEIENIMKNVDNAQGEVHIVSSDHEGGNILDGLGGIAGLLRYKL